MPLGVAAVRRTGADATVVATGVMVSRSLEAAERLSSSDGIELTVVDPRTLSPFDADTILDAVASTGRAVIVQEAPRQGGFGAEIAARIAESSTLYSLRAPVLRLAGLDAPMPYAPALERASVPQVDDIVAAVRGLVRGS
jgi:pyruvate dehydrogenase E1 component beta subunit